jgi:hypothetical protein
MEPRHPERHPGHNADHRPKNRPGQPPQATNPRSRKIEVNGRSNTVCLLVAASNPFDSTFNYFRRKRRRRRRRRRSTGNIAPAAQPTPPVTRRPPPAIFPGDGMGAQSSRQGFVDAHRTQSDRTALKDHFCGSAWALSSRPRRVHPGSEIGFAQFGSSMTPRRHSPLPS